MINLGMATAAEAKAIKSDMPFPECGAMSQGYIGYHLQNAIGNELASRGMNKDVATVVTQVLVDEADPAFQHPTKPVGAFYDKETADRIAAEKGYTMVEDAGRGYRQVVPSPKPIDVIEKNTVKALVDNGTVVITVGGGGIPVVCRDGKLYGTPAVIDKDFASAKLAELLDADMLVILTAVEKVAINFGKPDQKGLDTLTPDEARKYIDEKQFAPGSMLPKVQAAMSFAESKPGRVALITRQPRASRARPAPHGDVVLTELNEAIAAPGTAEKLAEVEAGLADGSIKVFDTSTFTVDGETLTSAFALDTDGDFTPDSEEAVFDGAFHESYFQSAPYFAIKIDGIEWLNSAF